MFGNDNLRSQTITLLKVFLPLAALALLSTVFLLARGPVTDGDIPYADIAEVAQESRVSAAQMSGVAEDGSVIRIFAETARPNGSVIQVEGIRADLQSVEGTLIDIAAGRGELDNASRIARLSGLARVETSNGYQMETSGLVADLNTGRITSDGELEVKTPFGDLTAGQLVIEPGDAQTGQRMHFQNGVRLLYQPQQQD